VDLREAAAHTRQLLATGRSTPTSLRAALLAVPPRDRDAWLDLVFGLDALPDDGPDLPRGCVPYLPCSVDAVLRMIDLADIQPHDIFIDLGAGLGRAALLTHLLTGASAIGVEIQPALVAAAHALIHSLHITRVELLAGDASRLAGRILTGTVFFLYCPFSGPRLDRLLDDLEAIARARQIRVSCLDLPLPPRAWLTPISPPDDDLVVHRSTWPATW
jgi:SAM-dependent methyltransferase